MSHLLVELGWVDLGFDCSCFHYIGRSPKVFRRQSLNRRNLSVLEPRMAKNGLQREIFPRLGLSPYVRLWLSWWEFCKSGWAARQYGGTLKQKSTQGPWVDGIPCILLQLPWAGWLPVDCRNNDISLSARWMRELCFSKASPNRACFAPHESDSEVQCPYVQRSAKVIFLGCVTRIWAWGCVTQTRKKT